MTITKREPAADAVTDTHNGDAPSESEAADIEAEPRQRTSTDASQLIMASAQDALNNGLDRLAPEVVQWGQTLLGSMVMSVTPLKRSLKTQPVLSGVGLGAIALGGLLVALAFTRDNKGRTVRPARAN